MKRSQIIQGRCYEGINKPFGGHKHVRRVLEIKDGMVTWELVRGMCTSPWRKLKRGSFETWADREVSLAEDIVEATLEAFSKS